MIWHCITKLAARETKLTIDGDNDGSAVGSCDGSGVGYRVGI
jgi:hypothetical protein